MPQCYVLHTLPALFYTKILCRKTGLGNAALVDYNFNVQLLTVVTEV